MGSERALKYEVGTLVASLTGGPVAGVRSAIAGREVDTAQS